MKVLASAYACEPGRGSESGIGWNWARQIARRHELCLITRENNVDDILRAAKAEELEIEVVGHDLPAWARAWKRGSRGAMPYFYLWQRSLASLAERLDREHDFDVLHHLTFASSWIPSGLAAVNKPFVWGPVGQHPRIPSAYLQPGDWRGQGAEVFKSALRRTLGSADPALRQTLEAADVILSLGREFGHRVPAKYSSKVVPMLACGTTSCGMSAPRPFEGGRFEVLFAGRLVDLKGARLALEAFAHLRRELPARFTLIGDGPLRDDLARRAQELGISGDVELRGNVSHSQALETMQGSHVFLFPSFEGAGMVVPEAMLAGNTVVCLDFGGPGEMVGSQRGLAVPLDRRPAVTIDSLGDALVSLARDDGRRLELAHKGQSWAAAETSWEAKGARLDDIYARAREHYGARNAGAKGAA